MALYLGNQKVSVRAGAISGPKYAVGTVVSDDNGIVTFPKLDFTPKIITLWNVGVTDLAAEWNPDEGNFPDDYIRYMHSGTMLMAINIDGHWVSQGLMDTSGGVNITNSTFNTVNRSGEQEFASSGITVNNSGIYSYTLHRYDIADVDMSSAEDTFFDITNTEFNYAIYGE